MQTYARVAALAAQRGRQRVHCCYTPDGWGEASGARVDDSQETNGGLYSLSGSEANVFWVYTGVGGCTDVHGVRESETYPGAASGTAARLLTAPAAP